MRLDDHQLTAMMHLVLFGDREHFESALEAGSNPGGMATTSPGRRRRGPRDRTANESRSDVRAR